MLNPRAQNVIYILSDMLSIKSAKATETQDSSCLFRLTLNLRHRQPSVKTGIHGKRLKAGRDEHCRLRRLTT